MTGGALPLCKDCGEAIIRPSKMGRCPERCAPCIAYRNGPLREQNRREYKRQRAAAWYEANKGKVSERDRLKRLADPEAYRAKHRVSVQRNAATNRSRATAWRIANPERRREAHTRRRARKLGVGAEPYSRKDIFDRDRWVCQLCWQPIDPALEYPDDMAGSIDHVVPLAAGGPDAPSNVQASHLICNIRKGARLTA